MWVSNCSVGFGGLISSAGRKFPVHPDQSGMPFLYPSGTGDKVIESMKLTT